MNESVPSTSVSGNDPALVDPLQTRPTPRSGRSGATARRLRRVATIGIAIVVAVLIWVLSTQVLGTELMVDQGTGPQPVLLPPVLAAPILAGLSGWGLLALLERLFPNRGRAAWRVIAMVVLVLSNASPLMVAESATVAAWLVAMHVGVGLILVLGLAPTKS